MSNRQSRSLRPDARRAASAAECAGRAGVASMPRGSRRRGAGAGARRCRHHDRPRRRADAAGVTLIDDSFNGNPASMVAALDSLKARPVEARPAHRHPRRHAGTGRRRAGLSRGAREHLPRHRRRLLRRPADAPSVRSPAGGAGLGWHEDPATLEPQEIAALLRNGDVVVVKGSKKMFWVNKFVPRLLAALQAKA